MSVEWKIIETDGQTIRVPTVGRKRRPAVYPCLTPTGYPLEAMIARRVEEAIADMPTGETSWGWCSPRQAAATSGNELHQPPRGQRGRVDHGCWSSGAHDGLMVGQASVIAPSRPRASGWSLAAQGRRRQPRSRAAMAVIQHRPEPSSQSMRTEESEASTGCGERIALMGGPVF